MVVQANLTSDLYGLRHSGSSHGDVFTSPCVVCFMLDLIGYTPDKDLSKYKVLEPSFGGGDFLTEIQKRLIQSAKTFNFNPSEIMSRNIYGCEIDKVKYDKCVESLRVLMPDFVPYKLKCGDFLSSTWDVQFDFIVGNPPYIRYENIPSRLRSSYKAIFHTFHYRSDLYILFYEHSLKNLSTKGRHCFICSNRWLKNEYGKRLRALISSYYKLEYIIDVEKLDAFKESVLAYPSITLISKTGIGNGTKIAVVNDIHELKIPLSTKTKKIEHLYNWDSLFLNDRINGLSTIEQQGFIVGIGVATGADRLFISSELINLVENELILPIVNAKDLTGNEFKWKGLYILNPYDSNGSMIDLNKYPKAKQYLEQFKSVLSKRHIVKNGRAWYSLIDKIKPKLVNQPKILLPDISGNSVFFIDQGLFYPAHNIYYITGRPIEELELLAAILMSKFVTTQMASIANKMNGGLPRWQSQSIRRISVPLISNIPTLQRHALIEAYYKQNHAAIDNIVEDIVNSQLDENLPTKTNVYPQSLFDYDFSVNTRSNDFGAK